MEPWDEGDVQECKILRLGSFRPVGDVLDDPFASSLDLESAVSDKEVVVGMSRSKVKEEAAVVGDMGGRTAVEKG